MLHEAYKSADEGTRALISMPTTTEALLRLIASQRVVCMERLEAVFSRSPSSLKIDQHAEAVLAKLAALNSLRKFVESLVRENQKEADNE